MARYFLSAMSRWKMRPVRSWAFSTPVALTAWAVLRKRRRILAASAESRCSRISFEMAKMGQ